MGTVRDRGRIRLARWILIPLAGILSVSSLAAPAGASTGPQVAASTLANVLSVASNNNADSVSGSDCALLSTGQVKCWGANFDGQLGNGTITNHSDVPVAVTGISDAKAVASDTYGNSFCAVLSTGGVKCWGANNEGQLGDGTTTKSDVPVSAKDITTATAIVGGDPGDADGFCALLSTKHVDCWGYNFTGELGNGTTTNSDVPVAVRTITNAAVLISGYAGFCALLSTSHVYCWGDNTYGELGRATAKANYSDVPGAVTGITDAKAVASGDLGSYCAVLSTGQVKCWGDNSYGVLGRGTTTNSDVPVAVTGISDAKTAASDGDGESFCAVLSTGHMSCWGFNNYGQLGNGTATNSDVPVSVSNITTAAAVVGTLYGFCALLTTSHIDCWGFNFYGELGNGTETSSEVPVAVHTITNAAALISGVYGYCALLTTSHVDCWGYNYYGQLGDGATMTSDVPVAVLAGN
jgi:alpha-tubulin suppressor-like RCC1 family protein